MTDLERKVADELARAIFTHIGTGVRASELLPEDRRAIARAIIPVVREDCAKVAEDYETDEATDPWAEGWNAACSDIAAALREGQ